MVDLAVEGRHALLFDDDATAAFVNSKGALVPWSSDAALLIDRYDARHLLDRLPLRPPLAARKLDQDIPSGVTASDLHLERYLNLPPSSPSGDDDRREAGGSVSGGNKGTGAGVSGSYQAVAFSYGNDAAADPSTSDFHPPFLVPQSLLGNLPPTEKLHQIIARTALFVGKHGGQSEIVLRVKQGGNPTFGFLMPDHQLHAYFRFLVDHPNLLKSETVSRDNGGNKTSSKYNDASGGALSLLGSIYGFAEDDDTLIQPDSNKMFPNDVSAVNGANLEEKSISVDSEDKAVIKHVDFSIVKERPLKLKNTFPVNASSTVDSNKSRDNISHNNAKYKPSISQEVLDDKLRILEPPSFQKRMIDKIVEFSIKNGKEFEAVLIEQDKSVGRFPFLLPSNHYHSYYLKILEQAFESKEAAKKPSDKKLGTRDYSRSTKDDAHVVKRSEGGHDPLTADLEGCPPDSQKEKFKMVISGPKKDLQCQLPKPPARTSGVSADEAAAIVLAATRGVSPIAVAPSSLYTHGSTSSKPASNGRPGNPPSMKIDASAAKVSSTSAVSSSREVDTSETGLTKEQKLKAERLKRAKMFTAMLKGGGERQMSEIVRMTSVERTDANGGGSPCDDGELRHHRKRHSRYVDDSGSEELGKHSKKRKFESSPGYSDDRRERRHHHRSRKSHPSRGKEHRHRHRYEISSEDEEGPRRTRHRRHKNRDISDDEDGRPTDRKPKKTHYHAENRSLGKDDRREDDAYISSHNRLETVGAPRDSEEACFPVPPSDASAAEVPDELRAKVRAMLLETI